MLKQEVRQRYMLAQIEQYKELREESGIYALLFYDEVIYVGQAQSIYKRMMEHRSIALNSRKNKNPKLYLFLKNHLSKIEFVYVPLDIPLLNKFEPQYISKWKPRFNIEGRFKPYRGVRRAVKQEGYDWSTSDQ